MAAALSSGPAGPCPRPHGGRRLLSMLVSLLAVGLPLAPAAEAQGETRDLVMPDGDVRSYILTLPPEYDPAEAAPAVLDFHGAGSNPLQQLLYSNLTPLARRDRVILVHPNSRSSDRPKVWWHGTLYLPEDDADVRFVDELVRVLAAEHGASAFYAMGMSSGGDISSGLACQPDSPFSGFGAVTHAFYWGTNPPGSEQPGAPNCRLLILPLSIFCLCLRLRRLFVARC
eukprot:SAG22_NODE_335_length_12071_cov_5.268771_8_plen_228_part_00